MKHMIMSAHERSCVIADHERSRTPAALKIPTNLDIFYKTGDVMDERFSHRVPPALGLRALERGRPHER